MNLAHGGAVVAAWDVDQLPDEWLAACNAVVRRQKAREANTRADQQVESHKAAWRNAHPGYRRHA